MFKLFGGAKVETVDASTVKQRLDEGDKPYILDVRTVAEFRQGHISGAHHIPLNELNQRLHEVPVDVEVVTVCRSGARSRMAADVLKGKGYKVKNMVGGMNMWKGSIKR